MASATETWFHGLRPAAGSTQRGDAGALAELRRARSVTEAVLCPAFHSLRERLPHAPVDDLALVATVVAHVRQHAPGRSVAAQLAGDGRRPVMHPRRFHRMLQEDGDWEARHRQAQRVVKLLDGTVNVGDLARTLYAWNEPNKRRWALDYFDLVDEEKKE